MGEGSPTVVQLLYLFRLQKHSPSDFQSSYREFLMTLGTFPPCYKGTEEKTPPPFFFCLLKSRNLGGKGHSFLSHKRKFIHLFSRKEVLACTNRGAAKSLPAIPTLVLGPVEGQGPQVKGGVTLRDFFC